MDYIREINAGLRDLSLFAGAGGGILGGKLLGWQTVCAVELDPYAQQVLVERQNEGSLPPFPIWDDIRTFNGTHWRGLVDVVSGGFPCQDISVAGKGAGISGGRSGLWKEMGRIIREVLPPLIFIENSPALTKRGLDVVLNDLNEMGYDAEWTTLSAAQVGAPHKRERIWILGANPYILGCYLRRGDQRERHLLRNLNRDASEDKRERQGRECGSSPTGSDVADTHSAQCKRGDIPQRVQTQNSTPNRTSWWETEPSMGRVADGLADRVDRSRCCSRLKAIGNGQVPLVAATAFNILLERFLHESIG